MTRGRTPLATSCSTNISGKCQLQYRTGRRLAGVESYPAARWTASSVSYMCSTSAYSKNLIGACMFRH